MAADDNYLTLQSIRTAIPWKEWGYELIACAQNGTEAWEKISKYRPDIVILDIHMPGMDGIEVASRIQEMDEKPVIIFLSAYDEFDYAQKGIRLGVFDYLLKPLDHKELKMILDKAAKSLIHKSAGNEKRWEQDWCEKLLLESIVGREEAVHTLGAYLSEKWHSYGYSLLLLCNPEERRKEFEIFRENIRTVLKKEPLRYLNVETKDGSLILIGFSTLRLVRDYDLEALYLANRIVGAAKEHGLCLSAGISDYAEQWEHPEQMYEEARFALESRFFLENKSVIHYRSVKSKSVHNEYVLSKKLQEFFLAVNQGEHENILEYLDEFIDLFEKDERYDVEYARSVFLQIAFSLSGMPDGGCMDGEPRKTMDMIRHEIQNLTGMQEMIQWIREYAQTCIMHCRRQEQPFSVQTQRVLDFLNTNYMKQLSLKDAAESAGVSEGHLCRLLKNETGETFVNILNKIRIQKAEQLIDSGNYKVYEVAEQVGISNYAYFYQVFRKITGVSPTEYQKKYKKSK